MYMFVCGRVTDSALGEPLDTAAASPLCAVGMSGGRYAERQEDELLFLREVFRSDLEDLRERDPWKVSYSCMSLFNASFCV